MPYMGSKSQIAEWIIGKLPPADTFVEPFAGGCAITHAAILSGKYKRIILSDITDSALVFKNAIAGKFRNEKRWISREDFFRLKDNDPYVRLCYSFGNDQKTYSYGRDIEEYKRAYHFAVVFQDPTPFEKFGIKIPVLAISAKSQIERYSYIRSYLSRLKNKVGKYIHLDNLLRLWRLQSLQSLQPLSKSINIEAIMEDYSKIIIPKGSIIYCDPPYRGTADYLNSFNFNTFDSWCLSRTQPIFISEYSMPIDKFECIAAMNKRSLFSANGGGKLKIEGIFVPKK